MTTRADEDIRRLDIAMNDARAVRGIQCVGNFDSEREHSFQIQPAMPGESSFSVEPSRYSIVIKERPSCSPTS